MTLFNTLLIKKSGSEREKRDLKVVKKEKINNKKNPTNKKTTKTTTNQPRNRDYQILSLINAPYPTYLPTFRSFFQQKVGYKYVTNMNINCPKLSRHRKILLPR